MTLPFSHPLLLLLLVVPVVLAVRVWRRGDSRLVLPFDHTRARRGRLLGFGVNLSRDASRARAGRRDFDPGRSATSRRRPQSPGVDEYRILRRYF